MEETRHGNPASALPCGGPECAAGGPEAVFEAAHRFVMRWEGGFCDDAADPGGATKYGVSLRFLRDEGHDIDGDGSIGMADVRAVTPEDAKRLFRMHFWPQDFARLAAARPRLAFAAYDTAVNMGLGTARRLVQGAAGTQADGIWGPKTWAALAAASDAAATAALIGLRRARYARIVESRPASRVFLRGWLNRCAGLERETAALGSRTAAGTGAGSGAGTGAGTDAGGSAGSGTEASSPQAPHGGAR